MDNSDNPLMNAAYRLTYVNIDSNVDFLGKES